MKYLQDRKLLLGEGEEMDVTCGVPQGHNTHKEFSILQKISYP
jgi:hypothetical protein